jgi:SAM-dependent methyltransferase
LLLGEFELICPHCRGELAQQGAREILCRGCARRFRVTLGIPDLRTTPDPYIGFDDEYAKVEKLVAAFPDHDFESFVNFYYRNTSVVPPQHAALYTRSLLAGVARARGWLAMWEESAGVELALHLERSSLLEVGCGTAPLLVAAENYVPRIGVDVALRWLIVARKRLAEAGLNVPLVCANAEALPFAPNGFDFAVLDSTLEHIADQSAALDQILRVLRPGGRLFLSTPNRFSLGPDPHTGVPAGSLLPESVTARIVIRQGGIPPKRKLLSAGALAKLLDKAGFRHVKIYLPGIPEEQRAHFPAPIRAGIALYEVARKLPVSSSVLRLVGPLLHATARRRERAEA